MTIDPVLLNQLFLLWLQKKQTLKEIVATLKNEHFIKISSIRLHQLFKDELNIRADQVRNASLKVISKQIANDMDIVDTVIGSLFSLFQEAIKEKKSYEATNVSSALHQWQSTKLAITQMTQNNKDDLESHKDKYLDGLKELIEQYKSK